ncbi:Fructosamine kinase-domain-containing protein [Cercophora newfieldiana]|uniref:protein-ribulosamine 3-kinase n=1 Tax=Cercophora newfieldiana TaxID=92897 RepID=A0AA39XUQ6_9PEZI|nr:Fructosamine kinase-domain-containing protein [Cercophora newfieldiana]
MLSFVSSTHHSEDSDNAELYRQKPLPTGEYTRVLVLHPGVEDDELSCDLEVVHLKEQENSYTALSYVWGNPRNTTSCICGDRAARITVNLAEALRALRDPQVPLRLWADAICINQADDVEKSWQVRRIGTIFHSAKQVLVWLGHDKANISADCFNLVVDTNRYLDERLAEYGNTVQMPTLVKPYPVSDDRARWDNLRKLLSLPWFRRVWVIQEAGLAKSCLLRWGAHTIEFAHIIELALWHVLREDVAEITGPLNVIRLTDIFRDVHLSYQNKETWRTSLPLLRAEVECKSQRQVFVDILLAASGMLATDKRDHVFAFLSSSLAQHPDGKPFVEPDYTKDLRDIYFETACSILRHPREAPYFLSRVKHRSQESLEDITRPSWLPRWDEAIDFTISRPKFWYRAGGNAVFAPDIRPDRSLAARGVVFDRITYVSRVIQRRNVTKNTAEWESEYREGRKPFVDVLWEETFAAAQPADVTQFEQDFAWTIVRSYPATPDKIGVAQQMAEFNAYRRLVRRAAGCLDDDGSDVVEYAPGCVAFPRNLLHRLCYCHDLRFAVLESGRLGLVPFVARPGDRCCVLPGVPVPMVLRDESSKKRTYRFIGESYVHGVMGGEVMALVEDKIDEMVEDGTIVLPGLLLTANLEAMNYSGTGNLEFGAGNTEVDPAVLRELPEGCKVTSTDDHGVSYWAKTSRIDVLLSDGTPQTFFIKVVSKDQGKNMVHGEFESMRTIYGVLPELIPKPIAWGAYDAVPETYFILSEFRDFYDIEKTMPDPDTIGRLLATLHQKSNSPNGEFGFHVTTYLGNLPQYVAWDGSWEAFFASSMRYALKLEKERKGPDKELDDLSEILFKKVIPRLLRPLETEGRRVKPSLVHGDLWYANSGVDRNNGQNLVFDACSFYAHNEYEFGQWRPACNKFGDEYIEAYKKFAEVSEPKEDFEGRLDLYRLKFDTHVSALFLELRPQVIEVMSKLVERYGKE